MLWFKKSLDLPDLFFYGLFQDKYFFSLYMLYAFIKQFTMNVSYQCILRYINNKVILCYVIKVWSNFKMA